MEYHIPIMLNECMEILNPTSGRIYLDATLGGAGHSYEILKRSSPNGVLIGIDRDEDAIISAKERLKSFGDRAIIVHSNYKDAQNVLDSLKIEYIDGAIMDLGISSHQIDESERGFSYMKDARLDMRMDRTQQLTAYDVVNTYSEKSLIRILRDYGEESFARGIVNNIIAKRTQNPITTTLELADIVSKSVPGKMHKYGHPAKKTFQAIRIEVNQELEGLGQAVTEIIGRLKSGGKIAVITFHSLEDRTIKQLFKIESEDCICDKNSPICTCNHHARLKRITHKPIIATKEEQEVNSRAVSAKLRAAEKI